MNRTVWSSLLCASLLTSMALACGGCSDRKDLNGAGASFIYPMMSKWASEYEKAKKTRINYLSIGSGGGITQMTDQVTDFGCSDGPMNEEQLKKAKDTKGEVVHIPLVMGAVAIAYKLDEAKDGQLKFTGPVLANIYLRNIKKWNDPAIQKLNPDVKLPDKDIVVVGRSDGSGTTYIFTDYLSKVSPEWEKKFAKSQSVSWPGEVMAAKGNEGVSGQVQRSEGSIGYVELTYVLQNKISYASIENKDGKFVAPSLASVTAAAKESMNNIPDDLRYSITNAPGADSYPISGTTWAISYINHPKGHGKEVREFLHWCVHDGQQFAEALHYARLPEGLVKKIDAKLELIK